MMLASGGQQTRPPGLGGLAVRVICSTSSFVFANLAWEEWWLDRFEELGPVLMLYRNDPAVVVGKNQNPWRETNPLFLADDGVDLARRVSGGGTVYHDEGNLNYSLILDRHHYRQDEVFRRVIDAVSKLGVPAEMMPANSIGAGGRKFSGHAFCFRGAAVLHHGTLLVEADLDQLRQAMKPALPDLATRAIASRPASVMNLTEARPGLTWEQLRDGLAAEFAPGETLQHEAPPETEPDWVQILKRHQTWEWTLGYTPAFSWTVSLPDRQFTLYVDRGAVQEAVLRHDAVERRFPGLAGCRFASEEILPAARMELGGEPGLVAALARFAF